ncbi:MAG: Asp-tRNA(Asn)/Glu-tRNA(Gln) amidotransferase subunit GatA, partial [Acidobacteria bacterium]|nr:Asp-tRNA(Asn)/Glu-tRNA(Gln) amidotransferase subunit GatA [Acidobacteriota bacterium]
DTGGSVRQPAALCGIVGLKPSYGRVSRSGLVAFASSLDQVGPMTRSVRDAALALEVLSGLDEKDSTSEQQPGRFLEGIEDGAEGWRVGVVRELGPERLDDEGRRAWRSHLDRLTRLGVDLVEVSVPAAPLAVAIYQVLANAEASSNLARFDGLRYGHRAGGDTAQEVRRQSRSEGFGAEVRRRILLGTFVLSAGFQDAYYGRARAVGEALRRQLDRALDGVRCLALPVSATAAFSFGSRLERPLDMALSDLFTCPASLAGLPALAVPGGLDTEGLPRGLQLIGRRFDERGLLRLARAFEVVTGWEVRPALREVA